MDTASNSDLSGGPILLSFSLGTAFFALATTFVRFSVRAGITKHVGVDDYTSGVATIIALVGTIFGIIEATTTEPARAAEYDILGKPWYLMSDTLSKISICLLFILLLKGVATRQWRILLSVLIFAMAAVNFSFALTVNLQCRPLERLWKPEVEGVCWDPSVQAEFGYFQGAFSVFTWFFLALFPILMVRNLERDGNASWPFYASTFLSFACGIFSIVRTAKTAQISDFSVYTPNTFCASLMSNLEQNFGLMAANVLTLGPLFTGQLTTFSSTSRSSRGKTTTTTISRTGSTRPITRASSSHRSHSSEEIDLKRTTHLIIQGPRRLSLEESESMPPPQGSVSFLRTASDGTEEYDLADGGGIEMMMPDFEAWPRGIIKTVSVEVVEEHNPDHVPHHHNHNRAASKEIVGPSRGDGGGGGGDRNSGGSAVEQDWEAMLRAGPPGR